MNLGNATALTIIKYPTPVLRKKAAPVTRLLPEIVELLERMGESMYAAHGVGLAAPQIGVSLRLAVVDIGDGLQMLVNPEIVEREGEQTGVEGCLSLPDLHGDVTRAQRVVVRATNIMGKKMTLRAEDYLARAIQHELDHLNGVLFTDRVINETLCWVTGETDKEGNYIERPTTVVEALAVFERQATLDDRVKS